MVEAINRIIKPEKEPSTLNNFIQNEIHIYKQSNFIEINF